MTLTCTSDKYYTNAHDWTVREGEYVRKKICGGETYEIIAQILHKFSGGTYIKIWDFQYQYWNISSRLMDMNKMVSRLIIQILESCDSPILPQMDAFDLGDYRNLFYQSKCLQIWSNDRVWSCLCSSNNFLINYVEEVVGMCQNIKHGLVWANMKGIFLIQNC